MKNNESFSGTLGFVIAAIGAAVGLGNYWRMPYLASQYGYIPFFIAFILCVLFVGIPLMFVELVAGRKFKGSFIETFQKLKFPWPGYISFFLIVILTSYYLVIAGWVLMYVLTFPFITLTFSQLISNNIAPLGYVFILLISAVPVYLGVRKGIEKYSKIFMLFLFLITLFILYVTVTSNPIPKMEISFPTSLDVWLLALSQSFFSLSVGFGVMFTYATYIKQKTSVFKDSLAIGFSDMLVGLIASFIIFVLLAGAVNTEGPVLVFDALSTVFSNAYITWLFYFCLLIAAVTSVISLLEFIVSNLTNHGLSRKKALTLTIIGFMLLSLPSALSYSSVKLNIFGMPVLDFLDQYIIGATAWLAIFFIIYLLWNIKKTEFVSKLGAGDRFGKIIFYWCKYVLPLFAVIMAFACLKFIFG